METYLEALLNVCPETKQQLIEWSEEINEKIAEGWINGLEAKKMYVMLETMLKNIKPMVDQVALEEAEKYEGKEFKAKGMKLIVKEAGVKYIFDNCNDPEFNRLSQRVEDSKGELKGREKFLKALTHPIEVHLGDGEVVEVRPPAKVSKTVVSASIL